MVERSRDATPNRVEHVCRFCGLPVEDGDWHRECVSDLGEDDRPEPFRGHPMYGPRPGPSYIQR